MTRQIAFYGRGGVGTSTIATNISAALADDGVKVVHIGCDPCHDSCGSLYTVMNTPSVLDLIRTGRTPVLNDLVIEGYKGIHCIELGNPFSQPECTARAVARSLELLQQLDLVGNLAPDLIMYDIPWENGCSGFITPLQTIPVEQVFLVISADFRSLSAANGILEDLVGEGGDNPLPRIGLIANGLNNQFDESFVADYARQINGRLAGAIPRSLVVRQSELFGTSVIEAEPNSNQAFSLRRLARQVASGDAAGQVTPMTPERLKRWGRSWGDLLFEMENGLISDGAAI